MKDGQVKSPHLSEIGPQMDDIWCGHIAELSCMPAACHRRLVSLKWVWACVCFRGEWVRRGTVGRGSIMVEAVFTEPCIRELYLPAVDLQVTVTVGNHRKERLLDSSDESVSVKRPLSRGCYCISHSLGL